jgi:hypothetical protein
LCAKHDLGDPVVYARWAALVRPAPPELTEVEDRHLWGRIAEALLALDRGA